MSESERAPVGIDPRTPNVARMYDYYLGGKDNYAADREAAEKVIALLPQITGIARANRAFLGRAVRHLTGLGVRQFLDIGAGLPTQENVHQVAQRHAPGARVVYADHDPVVLVHARALLANNAGTHVVQGDLRDPGAVFEAAADHLDLDRPVAVILCAILHFLPDDAEAERVVAAIRSRLVPGGALVISHGFKGDFADDKMGEAQRAYSQTAGQLTPRSRQAIAGYFGDLALEEPGLVHVQAWRPDTPVEVDPATPGFLGAVGVAR
ncbi:SAM-dependent methyltransferase [Bailinhaonella thermotolerans]|uniref:SAM-dependent methyltransferase n=1 Tax=Bailinhaonella thermotolerans TaxID=1070861 RepID=A0A3A4B8N2_9ACTN|nr:SAM-dependent methyltransferase [Bailinhaonella thermotolerans]RJL34044.1 SAM-dependent methyltransferase [Bailinhaonella thermotolerans]